MTNNQSTVRNKPAPDAGTDMGTAPRQNRQSTLPKSLGRNRGPGQDRPRGTSGQQGTPHGLLCENEETGAITEKGSYTLTDGNGIPVYDTDNTMTVGSNGPALMEDFNFFEKLTHFDRERIPERVVHAKGAGAFGYFQAYQSMAEYTQADFLQRADERTKILIRFSTVIPYRGSADTVRDPRGFAIKFYTKEGINDVVGIDFPVFFIRDAIKFPDFIHSQKPSPITNIQEPERIWDFYSLMPESLHVITWLYSDRGIVKDFSKIDGFGVNTFVWVNKAGKRRYVKYHFLGQEGIDIIDRKQGKYLAGQDPDIAVRSLYERLEAGRPVRYEFNVQMMDIEEADSLDFDPLDDTRVWPQDKFPLMPVGMLTLDENPKNYFAQIEQAAFDPSNMVPGIEPSADKMLQGRSFAYKDTQRYRIGSNYQQLPVNKSITPVHNNMQDGQMRIYYSTRRANYKPNNLDNDLPQEAPRPPYPGMYIPGGNTTRASIPKIDDFFDARNRFRSFGQGEKDRMYDAIGAELSQANKIIQQKQLALFEKVDPELAENIRIQIRLFETGQKD